MKTYEGIRHGTQPSDPVKVTVREDEGEPSELNPRLDLWEHSPDGVNWGYNGSGPAQLSLALLADATGDDQQAARLYQKFKFRVVSRLMDGWKMTDKEIQQIIRTIVATELCAEAGSV